MQIVLTQMHNFIKSNGAQPLGPLVQCIKLPAGPNPQPEVYMMQQATQLIPRMEAGYSMDAVLRVRNCLYAHYVAAPRAATIRILPPPPPGLWLPAKQTWALPSAATARWTACACSAKRRLR